MCIFALKNHTRNRHFYQRFFHTGFNILFSWDRCCVLFFSKTTRQPCSTLFYFMLPYKQEVSSLPLDGTWWSSKAKNFIPHLQMWQFKNIHIYFTQLRHFEQTLWPDFSFSPMLRNVGVFQNPVTVDISRAVKNSSWVNKMWRSLWSIQLLSWKKKKNSVLLWRLRCGHDVMLLILLVDAIKTQNIWIGKHSFCQN